MRARTADESCQGQKAGEIVTTEEGGILVACGNGMIRVEALQAQGRKPLEAEDFLRGYRLGKGDRFGGKDDG